MDFKGTVKSLRRAHRAKKTVLLRGNHGIGKSAVCHMYYKMLCKEYGEELVGYEDQRLSNMDVGDLRGIPFRVLGQTYFAPPSWLPAKPTDAKRINSWLELAGEKFVGLESKPYGVLLLDEMNRAERAVLQASYELTNDRRINGIHIPDGWLVVAAVNSDTDLYDVNTMDAALINRFKVIEFNPSPEEWFRFADPMVDSNRMHPSVVAFLRAHPEKMDPSKEDLLAASKTVEPLYTRRSWTNFGEYLFTPEGETDLTDLEHNGDDGSYLLEEAAGFLGQVVARAYVNFIVNDYHTFAPKDILDRWGPTAELYIRGLKQANRIHEITGGLNTGVLAELSRRPRVLPVATVHNILAYARELPGEVLSDFYHSWMKQDKDQSDRVYDYMSVDPATQQPLRNAKGKPVYPFKELMFKATSKSKALEAAAAEVA